MNNITFFENRSNEINKSVLFYHIISKEHRDFEDYLIMKCMTYCEYCDEE